MGNRGDELREGDVKNRGKLVVDAAEARKKFRKYRLPNPRLYVLQFVRTASVLGASEIDFTINTDTVTCAFDAVLPPEKLTDLWSSAFEDRTSAATEAAHSLAFGLGTAQAMKPASILVHSGTVRLTITGDEETVETEVSELEGTGIQVKQQFRLGQLIEYFTETPPEIDALRDYCSESFLTIHVNGQPLQKSGGRSEYVSRVRTPEGLAEASLAERVKHPVLRERTASHASTVMVLRDGVLLATASLPSLGRPARIRFSSRHVDTDLSGLRPVVDDHYHRLLHGAPMTAYHQAMSRWLDSGLFIEDKLRVLKELTTWAVKWRDRLERGLAPVTWSLLDRLCSEPLWPRATGPRGEGSPKAETGVPDEMLSTTQISLTEVIEDGAISYSRERFAELRAADVGPCIHQPDTSVDDLFSRIGFLYGVPVVDRTEELEVEARRRRNEARWKARPPREDPPFHFCREVRFPNYVGFLYLPIDGWGKTVSDPTLNIYLSNKLLSSRELGRGPSVDVDGSFETSPDFSDVHGDDFVRLIAAVVERLPSLMEELAESLKDAPFVPREHASILREWIVDPAACRERIFDAAGLESATDGSRESDGQPSPALCEVRCFEAHGRDPLSLGQLLDYDVVHVLEKEPGWEEWAALAEGSDEIVLLLVQPGASETFRQLLGSRYRHARHTLWSAAARRDFLSNPPYQEPDDVALARLSDQRGDTEIKVTLLPPEGEAGVTVHFLYDERLLESYEWPLSRGNVRAVIESAAIQPVDDYSKAGPADTVQRVREGLEELAEELLEKWWKSMNRPPDSGARRELWFEIAADQLERGSLQKDQPLFPIAEEDAVRFVSWSELRQLVLQENGTLLLARSVEQRSDEVPTLLLGEGVSARPIRRLFSDLTLAFAMTPGEVARKLDDFHAQPKVRMEVRDARISADVQFDRLYGVVGLYRENEPDRAEIRLAAVVDERIVEEFHIPVPFGRYRIMLTGSAIGPDPGCSMIVRGRQALLQAARGAAAHIIRDLCGRFSLRGHSDEMEQLVDQLLRYYGICVAEKPAPPFDLAETIAKCPMLRLTDGTCTSIERLRRSSGPVRFASEELSVPHVLLASPGRIERLRSILEDVKFVAQGEEIEPPKDPLLEGVTRELRHARGDRHLLGDDLLASIRWVQEDDSDGPFCSVTADEVTLRRDALSMMEIDHTDPLHVAMVASLVATEINRFYREISDFDEAEIQRRLLRETRR